MSYVYVVQMNIPAQHEAEFNRIYDTEHVPMLSKVPGVHKVTRYRLEKTNDPSMQKYLAIYEIDSPAIVDSKEWEVAGAWGGLGHQDPPAHHRAPPQLFREALAATSPSPALRERGSLCPQLRREPTGQRCP